MAPTLSVARTRSPRRAVARATRGPLLPVVVMAGLAVAWEAVTRLGLVSPSLLPSPSDTLRATAGLLASPAFWATLGLTVRAWACGLLLAASIALPLGVLLGTSARAYAFVRVPLEALRPVPPIVILPLALLLLGGSLAFQVALIVQGALWPLLIQTVYGIRDTDPVALDTARSFRLGRLRTLALVRLPSAAPAIATGLRLAAATAFAVTIVTELVGGAKGIGSILVLAQSGDDLVKVYAVTFIAGMVGLLIAAVFGLVERRFLAWRPGAAR